MPWSLIKVVAVNDDRDRQLASAHHFVKRKPQLVVHAKADPADAGWKALGRDTVSRHVQPIVQMCILGQDLFDLCICRYCHVVNLSV